MSATRISKEKTTPASVTTGGGSTAPIQTPDQRLRVFVSSTLDEPTDERRAVSRAVSVILVVPALGLVDTALVRRKNVLDT